MAPVFQCEFCFYGLKPIISLFVQLFFLNIYRMGKSDVFFVNRNVWETDFIIEIKSFNRTDIK